MSSKYTANFAWDLSFGQIRTPSKEKKKEGGQRGILNLNQKTIRSLSVCIYVYLLFFSDIIIEVVNEF